MPPPRHTSPSSSSSSAPHPSHHRGRPQHPTSSASPRSAATGPPQAPPVSLRPGRGAKANRRSWLSRLCARLNRLKLSCLTPTPLSAPPQASSSSLPGPFSPTTASSPHRVALRTSARRTHVAAPPLLLPSPHPRDGVLASFSTSDIGDSLVAAKPTTLFDLYAAARCLISIRMDLELDPNHRMAGRMKAGDERGAGRHGEPMSSVAGPSRGGEQGTTNSFVKLTPVQEDASTPAVARSLSYTRPVTRSMGEPLFGPLRPASRKVTLFRRKLSRASNRKSAPPGASSNLEDAKNIVYDGEEPNADVGPDRGHDGHAGVEFGEALESPPLRKPKGRRFSSSQLQAPTRRSARINGLQLQSRDTTPSMSWARQISRAETAPVALEPSGLGRPIRRSARDSKPLLEFHKYSELPPELKIMVWEAAIEPRAVYVRNRSAAPHLLTPADIQIRVPTWFMACQLSAWVARRNYQMLFSPRAPSIPLALLPHQNINPDVDIVVFEPCSSGCRGCYCACHQYTDESRHAVRFLAVQTEPPNLAHSALPCWLTLSLSWPNVETLYLMRQAVKGVDKTDKAIVRVKANSHEEELLKLFSEWKEDIGAHVKLTNIEFVVVVEKETGGDAKDRYKWVPDRATGQLQDVILG